MYQMIPETQGDFFLSQAWTWKNIEIGLVSVDAIDNSSN